MAQPRHGNIAYSFLLKTPFYLGLAFTIDIVDYSQNSRLAPSKRLFPKKVVIHNCASFLPSGAPCGPVATVRWQPL